MKSKKVQRQIRHKRVSKKIRSSSSLPRLAVFRSNKFIYAQIIDDTSSKTVASSSDLKLKGESKLQRAKKVGTELASQATKKNIKNVIFDRASYKYHGRIKALAEGAREGGLIF